MVNIDKTVVFIEKAKLLHNDFYIYDRVDYQNSKTPVCIKCPLHGYFTMRPNDHLSKKLKGCAKCGRFKTAQKQRKSQEQFIKESQALYGNFYIYDKVVYNNSCDKVEIGHPDGYYFWQSPANHLSGHRSLRERNDNFSLLYRKSNEEFINQARIIHGDRYDYDRVDYKDAHSKVIINCSIHGDYTQIPQCHLDLHQGCPRCSQSISSGHREICDFLILLGVNFIVNDREILQGLELDIVVPNRNIAIEYCGLYWHREGNHKDKNYHVDKHNACASLSIRLITIFEDEWINKTDIVKSTLRHLLGKSSRGVFARNTYIQEISYMGAKSFLEKHHLLGSGAPGTYRLGAFSPTDELIGVMIFGFPNNEQGSSDTIEMIRFVTDGNNNPGLGSKMFKHAVQCYNFSQVVAFVDRRWFVGEFKLLSGFQIVKILPPGFMYTDNKNRYHRRFMSKDTAIQLSDVSPTLSKKEIMLRLGYDRIWDCGKLKLLWTK